MREIYYLAILGLICLGLVLTSAFASIIWLVINHVRII